MGEKTLSSKRWLTQINDSQNHRVSQDYVFKKDGKKCLQWHIKQDSSGTAATCSRYRVDPNIRYLAREAGGEDLYIEHGDNPFSDAELDSMLCNITIHHPELAPYVRINKGGEGDFCIIVYEGIAKVLEQIYS